MKYSLVIGVDRKHLEQLQLTYPTWVRHKGMQDVPTIVFHDDSVTTEDVRSVVPDVAKIVNWPPPGVVYEGREDDKWKNPQRYKMLAGFVHVPPLVVETDYWLKVDTDTVAFPPSPWVDVSWFDDHPGIIAQPWGYTKPANQMAILDGWARHHQIWGDVEGLKLTPSLGSDRLRHHRIISWCSFFQTEMVAKASEIAQNTCGKGKLPVPSQDGYLWYFAKRESLPITRVDMKARGWEHWHTMKNIRKAVERSLHG